MLGIIKKIFDYFVWVMFFILLILGGIIFVTDRTYPGDKLYSFKLKFEDFALATSKILNKQVDFSITLVSKRSNEIAKILTPKNSGETLNRLDTQVETTAISITQISSSIEKKKAAVKYITTLNQVSSTLAEKQKEFVATPTPSPILVVQTNNASSPTSAPQNTIPTVTSEPNISQQIVETQETIEQTIEEMNEIVNQPATLIETPTPTSTPQPTDTPTPTSGSESDNNDSELKNNSDKKEGREPTQTPTNIFQPTTPENTTIPTEVPVNN